MVSQKFPKGWFDLTLEKNSADFRQLTPVDLWLRKAYLALRADGWMTAGPSGREESPDSKKARVPGNARRGQPQGKRHRDQTAAPRAVTVKRWGKSPPRDW